MYAHNLLATVVVVLICVSLNAKGENCIRDDRGLCIADCPPGTYSYNPSCTEQAMSQRTCRKPQARAIGVFCDYSRCDCAEPKVWDEAAKKCVLIQNCSDQSKITDNGDRV
ncbi:uncharacterized protein LOC113515612 [Galleria mellonella]|uniref:Uncharacterized protein LOC113515612 n=1 Tax=Galleria mellonella TaxID=7137 RepID=A0A6J1WTR1_GALME|nr:uncharacterized protein LOC113515612 [Galleria mellonella]